MKVTMTYAHHVGHQGTSVPRVTDTKEIYLHKQDRFKVYESNNWDTTNVNCVLLNDIALQPDATHY